MVVLVWNDCGVRQRVVERRVGRVTLYDDVMVPLDDRMMARALQLAEKGRGQVEPNPLVGAVVAQGDRIVGEGWHERFGSAHAEINALESAGESARGGTLYVSLEPCCHHGKTPPCTEAIIAAGVGRVVAAMTDPFVRVAGSGIERLRAAGIRVAVGVQEAAARRLNAPYLKLMTRGRPYVVAKWAMSLDGKIATHQGDARWISDADARKRVHELRGRMDGILVGIVTVLTDDPQLTARPPGPRTATRIILDRKLRLPPASRLVQGAREVPVLVFHSPTAPADRRAALAAAGCECRVLAELDGRLAIGELLDELGRRKMTNLLVEGGAEVLGSFFDAGEIDEVQVYLSPRLIGGRGAPGPIGGVGRPRLSDALPLAGLKMEAVGNGWLISGPITPA